MYAYYILLGKDRTLMEWADGLLIKKRKGWVGDWSQYPSDCNDYLSTCGAKNRYNNVSSMSFRCYRICFKGRKKAYYHDAKGRFPKKK